MSSIWRKDGALFKISIHFLEKITMIPQFFVSPHFQIQQYELLGNAVRKLSFVLNHFLLYYLGH